MGFLLLAGIEGASRLLVRDTHLDRIIAIIREDPVLFWRNRPNLDTTFSGAGVKTNSDGFRVERGGRRLSPKRPGEFRIVCLGESPTFGWGVEYEQAYPARLERLLRGAGVDAEVINAGMIGHSSHQGKILFKSEIAALAPDLITIPYVINDIDKYRFFLSNGKSDRETVPRGRAVVGLRNLLDESRFFRLFEKSMLYLLGRRASFEGRPIEIYRPRRVRVPLEDYKSNLREIIAFAARNKIGVILVKMPVNLPEAEAVPEQRQKRAKALLAEGIALVKEKKAAQAVEKLTRAVEQNPLDSEAWYFLGLCRRRLGDPIGAKQAFDKVFESEAYRCGRDGRRYNSAMEKVAKQAGLPLADVAAAFEGKDPARIFRVAERDPIHPTATGHEIIAERIFEIVKTQKILVDHR